MDGPGTAAWSVKNCELGASPPGEKPRPRRFRHAKLTLWIGAALLVASAALCGWSWALVGPAQAYRSGAVCAPDAPAMAWCRTEGTATVTSYSLYPGFRASTYSFTLKGNGRVPSGTVHNPLAAGVVAKVGSVVHVVAWQGHIVSASTPNGTLYGVAPPGQDLTSLYGIALGLLGAGLIVVRIARPRRAVRARPWVHVVEWSDLVVTAASIPLVAAGSWEVGIALLSAGWILAAVLAVRAGRRVYRVG